MSETLSQADLAFEGAQGFGAETDGGRGGEIVKVTTLADSGEGSLRWALEQLDGPRIVVFDVSGEINLKEPIKVNGDVTVAGQTSPGGVTVTGAKLRVVESDVIIRGLQFRPGDGEGDDPENRDGISIGSSTETVSNVIIDSNSFTWSVDELVTVWYGSENVTISNNIMAEALKSSIHPKGDHSMGLLVGDGSSNVTIVGNLLAHNEFRNATVKDDSQQIEFINNVIYNYGPHGFLGHEGTTAHIIGNLYLAGPDSAGRAAIQLKSPESGTAYYLEDNLAEVDGGATDKIQDSYVFEPSNVTVLPSSEVLDYVLNNVGARYPELSPIDERIIQTVIDGTGGFVDSPSDVGGYVYVPNTEPPSDRDNDGVPDSYEELFGTNPDKFDAHADSDGNGVSNIEDYINRLINGFGQVAPDNDGETGGTGGDSTADAGDSTADAGGSAPDAGGSAGGGTIRLEAENFTAAEGFFANSVKAASGGMVLQVRGQDSGDASMTFDGTSGTYDLAVGYFDEADGNASLTVLVNGQAVDSWQWDQDLGSDLADGYSQTERVIKGVEISDGDTIVLAGSGEGKEPLRVDYVDLHLTDAATGQETGETLPDSGSSQPVIKIEAEDMDLEQGFRIKSNSNASGGQVIQAGKGKDAKASTAFEGESGVYDIAIDYFDEADGASYLEVLVGGKTVDSWIWNEETEQALAAPDSLAQRVIQDIRIEAGDAIVLQGYSDGGEPLRIDSIELFADTLLA